MFAISALLLFILSDFCWGGGAWGELLSGGPFVLDSYSRTLGVPVVSYSNNQLTGHERIQKPYSDVTCGKSVIYSKYLKKKTRLIQV